MSPFEKEVQQRITDYASNQVLKSSALAFMQSSMSAQYSYNFSWLGRPIIQYPQDILAMQQLIWKTQPDLIIETGIAHGGSLIFSASMLAMLDLCDAISAGKMFDPLISSRRVLGIDIDIRKHNREAIEKHPMASRITMLEGSSIAENVVSQVHTIAHDFKRIMVCLDSNHTHDHVLSELNAYAPLTSAGNYCIVFDSHVEDLPDELFSDRPWGKNNNPKTAVHDFLRDNTGFAIDSDIHNQLQITVAPDGYLKRIA